MDLNDLLHRRDQLNQQLLLNDSVPHGQAIRSELTTIDGAFAYLRHHKGLDCPAPSMLRCDINER